MASTLHGWYPWISAKFLPNFTLLSLAYQPKDTKLKHFSIVPAVFQSGEWLLFSPFLIRKNRLAMGIINNTKENTSWASLTKALIAVFLLITCVSVINSIPVYTWKSVQTNTKHRLTENTNPTLNQHHISILALYFYNCLLLLFKMV